MAGAVMDDIDISNPPDFEMAPMDAYGDVLPDDEDFEFSAFDIGVDVKPVINDYREPVTKPLQVAERKHKPRIAAISEPATELRPFVELPESLMNTVIGKLARRVSECLEFPEASVFMAMLSSASSSVSTCYAVQYKTKSSIALGLYTIIEQPPATKKSFVLDIGMMPYSRAIGEHNKKIYSKIRQNIERKIDPEKNLKPGFVVTTDATSASLDKGLVPCSEGRFVVASAEQSALISLFPENNMFASNNELVLKGWAGEYVAGMRSGREAYSGMVQGSITLIAQPGAAKRVLTASNGSGMAERFMFMAEPDMLGQRQHLGMYPSNEEKASFAKACAKCVDDYSAKILSYANSNLDDRVTYDPENLVQLRASSAGYNIILQALRDMEPRMGELKESGDMIMLSWLGKLETHVLKIAAIIHVVECLGNDCKVPDIIPDTLICDSLDMVYVISDHIQQVLRDAGESGSQAEEESIISILSVKPMEARALNQAARGRKPFRSMQNSYAIVSRRIKTMIDEGKLMVNAQGKVQIV